MAFANLFEEIRNRLLREDTGRLADPFTFQIDMTGPDAGTFSVAFQDGTLCVEPFAHPSHDVLLTVSSGDLLDLLDRRADPIEAFLSGKIKAKGNLAKLISLKDLL